MRVKKSAMVKVRNKCNLYLLKCKHEMNLPLLVRTDEDAKMTSAQPEAKEPTSEEIAEQKKLKEEERKARVKQTVMKLFKQMKFGCNKEICYNKYCFKNHFRKHTHKTNRYDRKERLDLQQ